MLIKKYFNRPKNLKGIRLQEPVDYRILALHDDFRFLKSNMLFELLRQYHPEVTLDRFKHRLSALWANSYLDRPAEQLSLLVREDDFHLISCLTEKGAEVVSRHFGRDFQKTTWRANQDKVSYRLLEHQLAISRFRATIQLANAFEVIFWLHDRQFEKRVRYRVSTEKQQRLLGAEYPGEEVSQIIRPDSFFMLRKCDNKCDIHAYALEIDLGSQTVAAMARKYLAYYKLLRGLERNPITVEGKEISHFRVLTVSPDEGRFENPGTRIKHFQESVRAIDDRPIKGESAGYRAFWFTTEDKFSWQDPKSILKAIWQTSQQGEVLSLLD